LGRVTAWVDIEEVITVDDNYEEDGEQGQYEYEDEQEFAGLGASNLERPSFSDESLKYANTLKRSPYREDVINYVRALPLTARYKSALYHCIYTLFTEEQVLANNNPRATGRFSKEDRLAKREIFAQRNIELALCCNASKFDLLVCDVAGMNKYILDVYTAYISRTYGDKRERLINSEVSTRSVTQQEILRPAQASVREQRSRWGFLKFGGK